MHILFMVLRFIFLISSKINKLSGYVKYAIK